MSDEETRILALEEMVERWKDASGLEVGGDPDGVTPEGAREFWSRVEREAAQVRDLRVERDRYRDALEHIAKTKDGTAQSVAAKALGLAVKDWY